MLLTFSPPPPDTAESGRQYSREGGRCGQLGVDGWAGGALGVAGETDWRRQAVLVAELSRREAVLGRRFWQVRLGGHEEARDLTIHVVLLRRQGGARF